MGKTSITLKRFNIFPPNQSCLLINQKFCSGDRLSKSSFGKILRNRIPYRERQAGDSVFRDHAIYVFKSGSKTETGTGSLIFSDNLEISMEVITTAIPMECFA